MLTAYILIYSVTKNLPALAPLRSPAAAAPWVEATVRRRQYHSLVRTKGWPGGCHTATCCTHCCERSGMPRTCTQRRRGPCRPAVGWASHPYVVLHARHFKIQLEVVRVWAGVREIDDEKEGSETESNGYHQQPARHANQPPRPLLATSSATYGGWRYAKNSRVAGRLVSEATIVHWSHSNMTHGII